MLRNRLIACAAVSIALIVAGCEKKEEAPKTELQKAADQTSAAIGQAGDTAVMTILVAADEFDGKGDKTISKCPGCALGMDGKPANTIVYEQYTLYFCSPGCKDEFNKDVKQSVLAMNVPKK